MKSTWVAAGLLLVTICQAEQDYFGGDSTTPIPESMFFDKINYILESDGTGPSFDICLNDAAPAAPKFRVIFESVGAQVFNIEGTLNKDTNCINFKEDLKKLNQAQIYIVINALSKDEETIIGWGEAYFLQFPEFPADGLKASYTDDPPETENGVIVLRVEGALKDMTNINELVPTITSVDNDIHYYIRDIKPTTLKLCSEGTHGTPAVCDVVLKPDKTTTSGPTVDSAILAYSHGTTKGTIAGTVSSTTPVPTRLEVIISTDIVLTNAQFCQGPYSEKPSCEIEWSNPGEKTAQIRLMGITTDGITEINGFEIKDRELIITQLGTDILEARWIMHETETNNQKYRLTVNEETADVDCTAITPQSHCFGYKPVTVSNTYTFTVTNIDSKGIYNKLEQIQTAKDIVLPGPSQDLQIHALPMEWHQTLMEVNTTICFSHETPNEEMIFSHYEMLLINTRGQWLKHKVMEEDDNGDLCFTPFTINTQEFDVTEGVKVVVSQRASDGFSVIASGGSTLF